MASANVVNWKKEKVGTVDLSAEIFEVPVKKEILYEVVHWQLACRRQGTASTKTKGFVSGGGKKPFKQKGTGNARQGSTRSPLMPGGGTMFGPEPRDYSYALPKKVRRLGLRMALSHLNKEGRLFVVDAMTSEKGKTSDLNKKLKAFGLKKAILVDGDTNEMFERAAKNMKAYKYFGAEGLNVFDLLKYDAVVLSKNSLAKVVERCSPEIQR